MKDKENQVHPTQAIQMARFLSVAAVVGHLRGFFFRKVTGGAFGLVFFAGTGVKAAVISENFALPLGVNNRDTVEQVFLPSPTANEDYEIQIQQQSGTTITGGGQWVSVVMSGVTSPGPAELAVQSVSFQPYYGGTTQCNVVFSSVLGGYYKVQYVPYGAPPNSWQDAPGVGVIYSRADLCYVSFYLNPSNPVPNQVVAVSPNPFNLP